jgi:3'(2'), 5'-bisphosphate nucleotidase
LALRYSGNRTIARTQSPTTSLDCRSHLDFSWNWTADYGFDFLVSFSLFGICRWFSLACNLPLPIPLTPPTLLVPITNFVKSPIPQLTLTEILERTIELSQTAAAILKSYYRGSNDNLEVIDKAEGPVTVADKTVDRHLLDGIKAMCGDSCDYLTEETYQPGDLELPQDWVWIIDPLDGTRDFINKTGEYAIHVALTYQHRPVLAVVTIPESDRVYAAIAGGGTWQITADGNRTAIQVTGGKKLTDLIVVASRNHRSEQLVQLLARLPCQQQLEVGSIGCKIAALLERHADLYVSLSGKSAPKDWDLAAPELILTEAGGKFTHQDGSPLRYNQGDVNQWGCLIASTGEWHQQLLDACK